MKKMAALSVGFFLTACALGQHASTGRAGGGFGHSNAGFSSSHSFVTPPMTSSHSFASTPSYRQAPQYRASYNSPTGSAPFGGSYPYGERSHRNPSAYGNRPYYSRGVYLVPSWLGTGFYDYGYPADSSDQQNEAAAAEQLQQGSPDDAPESYAPPARPQYQTEATASSTLPEQPELTLLFKDGRPAQQVQNYAVTPTTLYVLDGARRREIPLDQLDLPMTERTNREAGVDFSIPTEIAD